MDSSAVVRRLSCVNPLGCALLHAATVVYAAARGRCGRHPAHHQVLLEGQPRTAAVVRTVYSATCNMAAAVVSGYCRSMVWATEET